MAHISKSSPYVKSMRNKRSASAIEGTLMAPNKRARETQFPECITLPADQLDWVRDVLLPAIDDCDSDAVWQEHAIDPRVACDVREMLPTAELRAQVRRKLTSVLLVQRYMYCDPWRSFAVHHRFAEIADKALVPLRAFVYWLQLRAQAEAPFGDWSAFWSRFGDVSRRVGEDGVVRGGSESESNAEGSVPTAAALSHHLCEEMSEVSPETPAKTLITWRLCCAEAFYVLTTSQVVALANNHNLPSTDSLASYCRIDGRALRIHLSLGSALEAAIESEHGTSPPFAALRQPNLDETLSKLECPHNHEFTAAERVQICKLMFERENVTFVRVQAIIGRWLWPLCSKQMVGIAMALAAHPAALPAEMIFFICEYLSVIVPLCQFQFVGMVQSVRRIQASKEQSK